MTAHRPALLAFVVAAAIYTGTVAAAQDRLPPGSEPILGAALRAARAQAPATQNTTSSGRPMTLAEATELALARNLDIAVERWNAPAIDLQLAGVKASYLPSINALFGAQHQTATPVTLLTGGLSVLTTTGTFNGWVSQNVPWGGGTASLVWNNNRVGTNNLFYNFNPAYNSTLTAQYVQPLLRGFHTDAVRQQLLVTKTNRAISDLQLKATVANTLTASRNAYWDLVFAVDSIDAAAKAVELARQLVEDNQKRVNAGTMTELDLISARAQEATSQHQLVAAEGNRRTAELALKRLLVGGADDPLWRDTLMPVDRPAVVDQAVDVEGAVRRALAERTDVAQAREQVAMNQATYEYLRDQTKAQADLVGTYALAGIGGTQVVRSGDVAAAFNAPVVATIPGSYGGAFTSLVGMDYPTWGIALNVTYPLGFSAARADAARAKVQIDQVQTQVHRIEVSVVTDVTNAAIAVRNNIDNVQTAIVARELAEQRLDAEQKRFAAGISTNYQIVQAQKDLSDARNAELQAQVSYRKSLVEFDRVQQTTLQSSGVTIVPAAATAPSAGSGRPANPAPSGAFIP
jgi:outer membrane protein TolC